MTDKKIKKYSKDFGNKEFLLNYVNRRWGLTKTNKVGEVMALIRKCQPQTFEEWEKWYFDHAVTKTKSPNRVTKEILKELDERLYIKLQETVIPQLKDAMHSLALDDCIEYIYELTVNRTYDGYLTEKSIITDRLEKRFQDVKFEETDPELDHAGDIDYVGRVGDKAFGIQIKPVTANANLASYSITARMEESFRSFEEEFGGKVFIIFSVDKDINNMEILEDIHKEIERLKIRIK